MSKKTHSESHTKEPIIITATILNLLLGYVAWNSMLDGQPVTLCEWFILMIFANIIIVIPICLLIFLICKIKSKIKEHSKVKDASTGSSAYLSQKPNPTAPEPTPSKQTFTEAPVEQVPSLEPNTEQISISLSPVLDLAPQQQASKAPIYTKNGTVLDSSDIYSSITPIDTTGFTDFDFFVAAGKLSIEHSSDHDKIKLFQRYLRIGFNYALRLCDKLCTYKVIKSKGSYFDVIMDLDSFLMLVDSFNGHMPDESAPSKTKASTNSSMPDFSNMNGYKFESWCAALLTINDFSNVTVTQGSGDHGADILAEKDDISYAFQCKYYSGTVGNKAVQEVYAAKTYYKRDIAVVMTNSTFTLQAQEEAAATHVKLWDKDKLLKLFQNCSSNK